MSLYTTATPPTTGSGMSAVSAQEMQAHSHGDSDERFPVAVVSCRWSRAGPGLGGEVYPPHVPGHKGGRVILPEQKEGRGVGHPVGFSRADSGRACAEGCGFMWPAVTVNIRAGAGRRPWTPVTGDRPWTGKRSKRKKRSLKTILR